MISWYPHRRLVHFHFGCIWRFFPMKTPHFFLPHDISLNGESKLPWMQFLIRFCNYSLEKKTSNILWQCDLGWLLCNWSKGTDLRDRFKWQAWNWVATDISMHPHAPWIKDARLGKWILIREGNTAIIKIVQNISLSAKKGIFFHIHVNTVATWKARTRFSTGRVRTSLLSQLGLLFCLRGGEAARATQVWLESFWCLSWT